MVENSTSMIGSQKKAATDGTETRKEMKGWKRTIIMVGAIIITMAFIIYWGYQIFGGDEHPSAVPTAEQVTQEREVNRPVEVYDVFVPGRGCSEPAPNTNPRFWINPFPKDARTGWPDLTLVITPKTGNGWVPYKDTMKSYSFIRWCNSTGRNMWMTVEVYKGRL